MTSVSYRRRGMSALYPPALLRVTTLAPLRGARTEAAPESLMRKCTYDVQMKRPSHTTLTSATSQLA